MASSDVKGEVITIYIKKQNELDPTIFKVKSTTKFSKIFDAWYAKTGVVPGSAKFVFGEGRNIDGEQTPTDIGAGDGDIIEARVVAVGGGAQH